MISTPFLLALAGGALLGLGAALLLALHGRIAGISGIVGGLLSPTAAKQPDTVDWRVLFVLGLLTAGAVALAVAPEAFAITVEQSPLSLILAGLLVGFGTRLGNGCTSGHGVCGISRGSPRSLASVATFMATGALAANFIRHLLV